MLPAVSACYNCRAASCASLRPLYKVLMHFPSGSPPDTLFGKGGGALWYTYSEASRGAAKLKTLNAMKWSKDGNSAIIVINDAS